MAGLYKGHIAGEDVGRHEVITRLHLKPTIGSIRLDKLNALEVQALYRSKLDSGLSPRTVQIIHATLYKASKQAVRWSLLPRNVCEVVVPPRVPKSEIKPLDQRTNVTAQLVKPKRFSFGWAFLWL